MTNITQSNKNDSGISFVFPGQGSQKVGMGKDLLEFETSKDIFDRVDNALNRKLSSVIFDGPADDLMQTYNAQPAIMTVSIACYEAMKERCSNNFPVPKFVAGHSLGEYTSLYVSGVLYVE